MAVCLINHDTAVLGEAIRMLQVERDAGGHIGVEEQLAVRTRSLPRGRPVSAPGPCHGACTGIDDSEPQPVIIIATTITTDNQTRAGIAAPYRALSMECRPR